MSTKEWTNPVTGKKYSIGTIGWEYKSSRSKYLGMYADVMNKLFPSLAVPMYIAAGLVDSSAGSSVPTYGLWAGPSWVGGKKPLNDGEIDWNRLPCYNESILGIQSDPNLKPENCYSLIDAITKAHDWRYTQIDKQYAKDNDFSLVQACSLNRNV